jgi:transposase
MVKLSIGQLATRADVNASTLRYYEFVGLLPHPERKNGQRRYDERLLDRINVEDNIRHSMQNLDFKLNTFTGIDDVTASAIMAEIGDISRFTNADKLAKYTGLTPSQMNSGGRGKDRNQRQGNRALNKILWGLAV